MKQESAPPESPELGRGQSSNANEPSSIPVTMNQASRSLEYLARICFVNIPTYILVTFPELDRTCGFLMAYLLFQVAGICWIILLNAGFAIATGITHILPEISSEAVSDYFSGSNSNSSSAEIFDAGQFSTSVSLFLVLSFYVAYASIKVFINFAQSVLHLGLQSTLNFPEAADKVIAVGGVHSLQISRWAFLPTFALLLGLIGADSICADVLINSSTFHGENMMGSNSNLSAEDSFSYSAYSDQARNAVCYYSGYYYMTSPFAQSRRIIVYTLVIMGIQTWQAYLHLFPNWDEVFKRMSYCSKIAFQIGSTAMAILSAVLFVLFMNLSIEERHKEELVCVLLFGWIMWLYQFVPYLIFYTPQQTSEKHGLSIKGQLQHLLACMRTMQVILLALLSIFISLKDGLLQSQMDMVFLTIILPTFYSGVFIISSGYMQVEENLLLGVGLPLSLGASVFITVYILEASNYGSTILVFFHIVSKWIELFGTKRDSEKDDFEADDEDAEDLKLKRVLSNISSHSIQSQSATRLDGIIKGEDSPETQSFEYIDPYNDYDSFSQNQEKSNKKSITVVSGVIGSEVEVEEEKKVKPLQSSQSMDFISSLTVDSDYSPLSLQNPALSVSGAENDVLNVFTAGAGAANRGGRRESFTYIGGDSNSPRAPRASRNSNSNSNASSSENAVNQVVSPRSNHLNLHKIKANKSSSDLLKSQDLFGSANLYSDKSSSVWETLPLETTDTNLTLKKMLQNRAQKNNPLASSSIPVSFRNHWLPKLSRRNFRFLKVISGVFAFPESVTSSIIRAFASLGIILILAMAFFAIAAYVQGALDLFPRLIAFRHNNYAYDVTQKSGKTIEKNLNTVLFDHIISNVTIQLNPKVYGSKTSDILEKFGGKNIENIDKMKSVSAQDWGKMDPQSSSSPAVEPYHSYLKLEQPTYSICDWKWNELSVLDLAMLSEVAYFNDDGDGSLQHIVDILFPHQDLKVSSSHLGERSNKEIGARFVEISSEKLGMTVIAVRGTDVGRLQDFMEDFKLYSESVSFSLLSAVFPSIRLWNHDTTARIIEWLFLFNSFFGLQGEADYYRPLTERVIQLSEEYNEIEKQQHDLLQNENEVISQKETTTSCVDEDEDEDSNNDELNSTEGRTPHEGKLVITGHSLGGGLARIVGTLAGQQSVSFAPPGLGLSYRKYSVNVKNRTLVVDKAQMDHQSMAVVTEFDPVVSLSQV